LKNVAVFFALLLLIIGSSGICQTKAAIMYGSGAGSQYKNEQAGVISSLGWSQDLYENTQVNDLAGKLGNYDIVILNTLYNLENAQDLSTLAAKLKSFVASGGCLVVTDTNYNNQTMWLRSIDPGLIWRGSGKLSGVESQPASWVNSNHPLMAGVDTPKLAWTFCEYTGMGLTPLVKFPNGRPAAGVMELGKGVIVVSNMYRQHGWPSTVFLTNLIKWAKDPARLDAVSKRDAEIKARGETHPALNIPVMASAPSLDGSIAAGEWNGAAIIPAFYDVSGGFGYSQPTVCRVGRYKDDLYVLFECTDTDVAGMEKGTTGHDSSFWLNDCVEVFLDPSGERKSYYQFGIGCSGAMYDARMTDVSWNTFWEAKTSIGENGWTAEIRIPFASLGNEALASTGTWAANFCRTVRSNTEPKREITNWSPTFGFFRQPGSFGTLTGMTANLDNYSFRPGIETQLPKLWFPDMKQFTAVVSGFAGRTATGSLELLDTGTGKTIWSKDITVGKSGISKITVDYQLDPTQPRSLQLVVKDSKTPNQIAAYSDTFTPTLAPDLSVQIIQPAFRTTIQSKDPEKKLKAECVVGTKLDKGMTLVCSIKSEDGKEVFSKHQSGNTHKTLKVETDLSKLPVGQYQLVFDVTGKSGTIASKSFPLVIAPPAKTEVTFDSNKTCYVNGKPFFPIGLYHVSPAAIGSINGASKKVGLPEVDLYTMMKEVKARGFNVIHHTWGMPTDEYLKEAADDGLWVLPEVAAPSAEQVATANKYGNVLMWYGADEPAGERLVWIRNALAQTSKLDPHRPVSAAVCFPDLFKPALEGFDFVMMDPYFVGMNMYYELADWIKKGNEASNGTKAVWLVPQAFTIGSTAWVEPTPDDLRCQAYVGLVHSVKGFIWYAFWTSEYWPGNSKGRNMWFLPDTALWDYFPKLNAEISDMAPVYLTGKSTGPVICTSKDVHTNLWKLNGKTYIIAVNATNKALDCEIGGFGKSASEVKFESRKVTPSHGKITEHFKAMEAHVYQY